MECNRDEAARAKLIAETKLENKDFVGAKKFALKAQTLYPGLDGISQLLTTLDVYVSADNKISGEVDWYGVLGVSPVADEETIRKQYRKLALLLHPDKNKAVGADGAFKLISEAWTLLSDKVKRLAYNQRRGSRVFQHKVPMHTGGTSAPPKANGFYNVTSRTSVPKSQNNTAKVPTTSAPPPPPNKRTDTFWTICHRCKMHYEYLKMYLNSTLQCPNCKGAFRASETAPPFNFAKSANQGTRQREKTSGDRVPNQNASEPGRNGPAAQKLEPDCVGSNSFRDANFQQGPLSGAANVGSTDPSIAAKAANVVQQAQDKLKRAYNESNPPAGWDAYVKKRRVDNDSSRYGMNYNMAQGNGGLGNASSSMNMPAGAPGSRIYGFSNTCRQPNSTRDLTPLELRNMLFTKARKEIVKKLKDWESEATAKASEEEKEKIKEGKKVKGTSASSTQGQDQNGIATGTAGGQLDCADVNEGTEDAAAAMSVPDPDFHDFDQDRDENSFGDNEVWAAYDDDDGMPRFYALISKVISRNPFKLRISWLNSKTNSEFGNIDWVGSGFYKTCGEFRVGRYEASKSINSFSQKVNWSKSPRGSIVILPQKDDVWALYKNWSADWNAQTPDEIIHKYDMVTVLDDYNEEQGVPVAPLVKVAGFKTVFRPNTDLEAIKRIPKTEMFRFSHCVPYHLLTGEEGQNAPKGCLELDPAATPIELLQVITEANKIPPVPDRKHADEEMLQNSPNSSLHGPADRANDVQATNAAEQS